MIKESIKIKGQRGFGDSLCLFPIVDYLKKNQIHTTIYTDHAYIFEILNVKTKAYEETNKINAGYIELKKNLGLRGLL